MNSGKKRWAIGLILILVGALTGSAWADFCTIGWSNDARQFTASRYRPGGGVWDGEFYMWGGAQYTGGPSGYYIYYADTQIYNPAVDEWQSGASMPEEKSNFGFDIVDGFGYAVGGYYSDQMGNPYYLDSVYKYDIDNDTWSTIAAYPKTFSGLMCSGAGNGKLYCYGGWDGVADSALGYVYNPGTNAWSAIANMPHWKDFGYAAFYSGEVYAIGGWLEDGGDPAVYRYATGSNQWTQVNPATGRQSPVAAAAGGLIWLAGGCDENDEVLDIYNEVFDGSQWSPTGEKMKLARAGALAGYVPGYGIFVVGGWDEEKMGTRDTQLWNICLPEFTSVTPATGAVGTPVAIVGDRFEQDAEVYLADATKAQYQLDDIEVVDENSINAVIPDEVTPGVYALVFKGTVGQTSEFAAAFEVVTADDDTTPDDDDTTPADDDTTPTDDDTTPVDDDTTPVDDDTTPADDDGADDDTTDDETDDDAGDDDNKDDKSGCGC